MGWECGGSVGLVLIIIKIMRVIYITPKNVKQTQMRIKSHCTSAKLVTSILRHVAVVKKKKMSAQQNIQQQIKMNSVCRGLPEKTYGLSKLAALNESKNFLSCFVEHPPGDPLLNSGVNTLL